MYLLFLLTGFLYSPSRLSVSCICLVWLFGSFSGCSCALERFYWIHDDFTGCWFVRAVNACFRSALAVRAPFLTAAEASRLFASVDQIFLKSRLAKKNKKIIFLLHQIVWLGCFSCLLSFLICLSVCLLSFIFLVWLLAAHSYYR